MKEIVIIGSGGHAKSVMDAIESRGEYKVVGFVGPDGDCPGYRGRSVICDDDGVADLVEKGVELAAFGIGFMGGPDVRIPIMLRMAELGFKFPAIIDPSAVVASDAEVSPGAFIGKRAVVNSAARVGELAIVNTGAVVEHDCNVGLGAHVSVGAVLCGGVAVGRSAFVGAGATVIQGLEIGEGALVGADSTILRDVPVGEKAVGLYA